MSSHTNDNLAKITVPAIQKAKERGEKLVCLTAYDYPTGRIVDEAGIELILVGDSAGNVVFGYENTIPVSMEEMLLAVKSVRRGVKRALLVADMPYGSYHVNADETVRNALRFIKEGGAEAVKLEGGRNRLDIIKRLVNEEIPVMGHLGLTPQSVNKLGGYRLQAKTEKAAQSLIDDAKALEDAGVFSIVLELVPREVAQIITQSVKISTVGIGAGANCDIQVLVLHDLLGLNFNEKQARFVRKYATLRETMTEAVKNWASDVKNGEYPNENESFALPQDVQLSGNE
ncbi:MAG: 3-methyl-2-oxobutanoate hydroxymethyltransferase [Pyrinomonadaceae bacterium]